MNFSLLANNLEVSPLQEALLLSRRPGVIPFSLGMPEESTFSIFKNKEFIRDAFSTENLQYKPPSEELKSHIVSLMRKRNVVIEKDQVFLTTGAQQALYLILKLLCNEGDKVVVDRFTYPGFIQPAYSLGIQIEPLEVDFKSGMDLDHLKGVLQTKKPKLIYTISNGHNPLGITFSLEQRQRITALAEEYQVPILEDDAYGFLSYEKFFPPLRAFSNNVIYVGTFSKIIGPSFRVGWIIIPKEWVAKLSMLKESIDLNAATFSQEIINSFLKNINIDQYLSTLSQTYKIKRNKMVSSLNHYLPNLEFEIPSHGFFIWGKFLDDIDTKALFFHALHHQNVSFIPSSDFDTRAQNKITNSLRLSFSCCPDHRIEEGIEKIKKSLSSLKKG